MSSRPVQLRPSLHSRVEKLEARADTHDVMAGQVKEMFEVFNFWRRIGRALNRWSVKIGAIAMGLIATLAALLTIWEKAAALLH
jgi:hypothetical protein